MTPRPPRSTTFPYTTLFRSAQLCIEIAMLAQMVRRVRIARAQGRRQEEILRPERPRVHHQVCGVGAGDKIGRDRKSTRLNSSHVKISYAVFCLKKKKESNST